MNRLGMELKGLRGINFVAFLLSYIYIYYIVLTLDSPSIYLYSYFNEFLMFPVIIILTISFFQKELGGNFMEIYVTLPISLPIMIIRKLILILSITTLLHLGWVIIYLMKFGKLITIIFPLPEGQPYLGEISWIMLYIQSIPNYIFLVSLTIFGLIMIKEFYGGLALGFGMWMLENLSQGNVTGRFSIYTQNLWSGEVFLKNKIILLLLSLVLIFLTIKTITNRERWIRYQDV